AREKCRSAERALARPRSILWFFFVAMILGLPRRSAWTTSLGIVSLPQHRGEVRHRWGQVLGDRQHLPVPRLPLPAQLGEHPRLFARQVAAFARIVGDVEQELTIRYFEVFPVAAAHRP